MCIRLYIHNMSCDARPFLTIARESEQGRLPVRYVNPSHEPLKCPHDHLRRQTNCPWNGCCTLETLHLHCESNPPPGPDATKPGHDHSITECLTDFREYHGYQYRNFSESPVAASGEVGAECDQDGGFQEPHLDDWVIGYLDSPKVTYGPDKDGPAMPFTRTPEWARATADLIEAGERLNAVLIRTESHQEVIEDGIPVPTEILKSMRDEIDQAWERTRKCQERLRCMDRQAAEALLDFDEKHEKSPRVADELAGHYPGATRFF
ncbi:hypothetical protein B0H67DRAFT_571917 [Lasiosphaeris hirsuta]|uniref:Uncharacterized protein n=1 Tax=Lasiosphaeris hirsuta TaxID=260670 RepID=A0AA40E5M5_9PEZI|nr:hypothetical protein B0H67DRAFT_571917 [Lasiosphaeris hirsuta]